MFWMAVNLVCITFICRFPWKSRKKLKFGTVDHIKSVKRALSSWLKGHSKHHHKIRNRRNVRINRLKQLFWTVCHDARVSFVNSCDEAFWFLLSLYIVLCNYAIFSVKNCKIIKHFEKMTSFFNYYSTICEELKRFQA